MWKTLLTGSAAAVATLALAGAAFAAALPGAGSLPAGWTRAEINVTVNHSPHTLVFNRGQVQTASASSLTLREADGSVVVVPLGPATQYLINGQPGSVSSIRPSATAMTLQIDGSPAQSVEAKVPPRLLLPPPPARVRNRR